jgi:hypothetical protein
MKRNRGETYALPQTQSHRGQRQLLHTQTLAFKLGIALHRFCLEKVHSTEIFSGRVFTRTHGDGLATKKTAIWSIWDEINVANLLDILSEAHRVERFRENLQILTIFLSKDK